jgi:predicted SPOUT superfamily RNA methylase MTH1
MIIKEKEPLDANFEQLETILDYPIYLKKNFYRLRRNLKY